MPVAPQNAFLSFQTELYDRACGNPNTAARRFALIVR